MLIAANLGVLDEVELIGPCVEHLQQIGADIIVVGDMGSTDGTRDALSDLQRASQINVIDMQADEDALAFHQRVFDWTSSTFQADRIFALDADEFWLPESGSIKIIGDLDRASLSVKRFNIPLRPDGPAAGFPLTPRSYDRTFIVSRPIPNASSQARKDDFRHIFAQIGPKAMLSPKKNRGFSMGGHAAVPRDGLNEISVTPRDVVIVHLAFSTLERFTRKIENIRNFLAKYGDRLQPGAAWHWRRWIDTLETDEPGNEFRRQIIDEEEFHRLTANGGICSVRSHFERSFQS
jgi:hypothetical protein